MFLSATHLHFSMTGWTLISAQCMWMRRNKICYHRDNILIHLFLFIFFHAAMLFVKVNPSDLENLLISVGRIFTIQGETTTIWVGTRGFKYDLHQINISPPGFAEERPRLHGGLLWGIAFDAVCGVRAWFDQRGHCTGLLGDEYRAPSRGKAVGHWLLI